MFFRSPRATLVSPADNTLKYEFDEYASVMQFISKNKVIPARLASFKTSVTDQENIRTLAAAIKNGNLEHELFFHPDCQLYVLYLFKESNQLTTTDFLALNTYLIALMQFTNKQNLKKEDEDIKQASEVKLFNYHEVEEILIHRFELVCIHADCNFNFNQKFFAARVASLNPLNKLVIGIKRRDVDNIVEKTLKEISGPGATFMFKDADYYYIPSPGLIMIIMQMMHPGITCVFAPIFGNISIETLYKFHQKGLHPISLYSPMVESNPKMIHKARLGPLLILLHDLVVHLCWANLFTPNQYAFIHEYLLPKVSACLNITFDKLMHQTRNSQLGDQIILRLIDLDVINSEGYYNLSTEAILYEAIRCCVGKNAQDAFTVLVMLYHDRNEIKATYGVDIEKMFENDSMLERFPGPPSVIDIVSAEMLHRERRKSI